MFRNGLKIGKVSKKVLLYTTMSKMEIENLIIRAL